MLGQWKFMKKLEKYVHFYFQNTKKCLNIALIINNYEIKLYYVFNQILS